MKRPTLVLCLVLLGILLSGYALHLHYKAGGGSICDISDTFSCDKVNKSPWSEFFGIPVALLGLLSYLVLFIALLKANAIQNILDFTDRDVWQYTLVFIAVMTLFQVYLTFVEVFRIHAYCLVCLVNQGLLLLLLGAAIAGWTKAK